jgi:hypothetical protein
MAINHTNRVWSAFNVLEKLQDKDPSVVGSYDHAWEFTRRVERLFCNVFVSVKEGVLVLAEVVLCNERVQAKNAVAVALLLWVKLVETVQMNWQFRFLQVAQQVPQRPSNKLLVVSGNEGVNMFVVEFELAAAYCFPYLFPRPAEFFSRNVFLALQKS